ncbi:BCKDHA isoform 8, partial [Pongo abelii]
SQGWWDEEQEKAWRKQSRKKTCIRRCPPSSASSRSPWPATCRPTGSTTHWSISISEACSAHPHPPSATPRGSPTLRGAGGPGSTPPSFPVSSL